MGTSTNPSLYRCPLTWQQPDISVNNFSLFVFEPLWFLYSVSLYFCTVPHLQYSSRLLIVHSVITCLTAGQEVPRAGSAPTSRVSEPYFANKATCYPFCSQHVSCTQSHSFSTIQKCRLDEIWSFCSTEFWEIGCSGLCRLGSWVFGSLHFEWLYCLYLQGAPWLSRTDFKRIGKGSNSFSAACFSRNMPCLNNPDGLCLYSPLPRPLWHMSSWKAAKSG